MSNHIHLLTVPEQEDSMALAIGRAHMRHSRRVNYEQLVSLADTGFKR